MDAATAPGTVAERFAARRRAWEEEQLSPLAARSYPAERAVAEEDCALRTPLQRDRDRIVHCKAFRRLKHKTQVFVAPEGDHYRTRHDPHARGDADRAHRRARARAQRGPRRGDRPRPRPRPPAVRAHRRGRARRLPAPSASAAAFATTSTRCASSTCSSRRPSATSRARRGSEPLRERARRDRSATPAARRCPRTLEGRIVRIVDRVAYINHDIDDALRAGVLDEAELPAAAIAVLGATGSARIDALVHDLVETSEAAGDIVQGERGRRGDGRAARVHVRARLPRRGRAPRALAHRARPAHAVRRTTPPTRRSCPTAAARPAPTTPSA